MTLEELITNLKNISDSIESYATEEKDQIKAENLLLKYINDTRVTKAFKTIKEVYNQ